MYEFKRPNDLSRLRFLILSHLVKGLKAAGKKTMEHMYKFLVRLLGEYNILVKLCGNTTKIYYCINKLQ